MSMKRLKDDLHSLDREKADRCELVRMNEATERIKDDVDSIREDVRDLKASISGVDLMADTLKGTQAEFASVVNDTFRTQDDVLARTTLGLRDLGDEVKTIKERAAGLAEAHEAEVAEMRARMEGLEKRMVRGLNTAKLMSDQAESKATYAIEVSRANYNTLTLAFCIALGLGMGAIAFTMGALLRCWMRCSWPRPAVRSRRRRSAGTPAPGPHTSIPV